MQPFLLIALLSIIPSFVNAQNTINGRLADYADNDIVIYRYEDYISKKKSVAGTTHTDKDGYFTIRLNNENERLQIVAGNKSLNFYVLQHGEYTIQNSGENLQLADEKGAPVNRLLYRIDSCLSKDWYPLFINLTDGSFREDYHPDTVLLALARCRAECTNGISNAILQAWMEYKFAIPEGMFLSISTTKTGEQKARTWLDQFETKYFNTRAVAYNNPFYIQALNDYMQTRENMIPFHRAQLKDWYDSWGRLIGECRYFSSKTLQELAIVNGIKELYKSKFHGRDSKEIKKQIQLFEDSIQHNEIKEIYRNTIAEYNKIKPGDIFPALTLKNESGVPASIEKISADYILIDFWATWCYPCREHMKKFPGLMQKYDGKLMIVSISVDESLATMKRFLDQNSYTGQWTTLHNGTNGNYHNKVPIDGYPTYYILDKERKIIAMPFFADVIKEIDKIIAGN